MDRFECRGCLLLVAGWQWRRCGTGFSEGSSTAGWKWRRLAGEMSFPVMGTFSGKGIRGIPFQRRNIPSCTKTSSEKQHSPVRYESVAIEKVLDHENDAPSSDSAESVKLLEEDKGFPWGRSLVPFQCFEDHVHVSVHVVPMVFNKVQEIVEDPWV